MMAVQVISMLIECKFRVLKPSLASKIIEFCIIYMNILYEILIEYFKDLYSDFQVKFIRSSVIIIQTSFCAVNKCKMT